MSDPHVLGPDLAPTPFTADESVDADALCRLAGRLLDDGATGLVVLGTTGEPAPAPSPAATDAPSTATAPDARTPSTGTTTSTTPAATP